MIHIFLRIRQNTCSSAVENISFFDPRHFAIEQRLIKQVTENAKFIAVIDQPLTVDLKEIALDVRNIEEIDLHRLSLTKTVCIFLSDPQRMNKIKYSDNTSLLHVIRHEGDFSIDGQKVVCDCNHCLITALIKNTDYHFFRIFAIEYDDGNQYTAVTYHQKTNKCPPRCEQTPSYGCKLQAPIIRRPSFTKDRSSAGIHEEAYAVYRRLGSPQYFCAPMIGQSELAFRMLVREQGKVHIASTQMIVSDLFLKDPQYQQELFTTCEQDHPLAVQFAANEPNVLLQAAKMVEPYCDVVDINLGCPQPIGRRHHYGAWLMEDQVLVYHLIKTLKENLKVPVTCKIRIFESIDETIKYAKMIEAAGCSLLTVHGRTRQCHMNDKPADWQQIKAVKASLVIPVVANGSIYSLEDANHCLTITGCDGVMAASKILAEPLLFLPEKKSPKTVALMYLQYAKKYQALLRYAKPHVIQILAQQLQEEVSEAIKSCQSLEMLEEIIMHHNFENTTKEVEKSSFNLLFENTMTY